MKRKPARTGDERKVSRVGERMPLKGVLFAIAHNKALLQAHEY
jgi:hypothetical protein